MKNTNRECWQLTVVGRFDGQPIWDKRLTYGTCHINEMDAKQRANSLYELGIQTKITKLQ